MNWRDLLTKCGVKTREDEEPSDLEARADALTAAFPDDDAFVGEQIKQGHGVPEAVAEMRAAHAADVAALIEAHDAALAEAVAATEAATAAAEAAKAELADAQARIVQLESLPHEGAEPVATTVPDAKPAAAGKFDHLTPARATFAAALKLPTQKDS